MSKLTADWMEIFKRQCETTKDLHAAFEKADKHLDTLLLSVKDELETLSDAEIMGLVHLMPFGSIAKFGLIEIIIERQSKPAAETEDPVKLHGILPEQPAVQKTIFDVYFPNTERNSDKEFEGSFMWKSGVVKPCWHCESPTEWVDINFAAHLCSVECARAKWGEYEQAERAAQERDRKIDNILKGGSNE